MKELLFLFVLFVSNVIQAITGFAGTVLAMPPSVYLLGLDHAKVVLNVMAWLSGLMIAVTGYRHINWPTWPPSATRCWGTENTAAML